jgi:hypothetical protein
MASSNRLFSGDYTVDESWHRYGVRVAGNQTTVLIDGGIAGQITDNSFLSGGRVGLWDDSAQVSVRSFKIVAQ